MSILKSPLATPLALVPVYYYDVRHPFKNLWTLSYSFKTCLAQVKQGDIIEVDSVQDKRKSVTPDSSKRSPSGSEQGAAEGDYVTVRRGRVVVKEIGEQTRKGGYHLTLIRYKHFALIQRRQLHCTMIHCL